MQISLSTARPAANTVTYSQQTAFIHNSALELIAGS
jgi:hypothetical protein